MREEGGDMEEVTSVTYRIPKELKEKLIKISACKGMSVNSIVIDYLSQKVEEEYPRFVSQNH